MKSYLVTGGAGFIGSNFIHYLMDKYQKDVRIINLDSLAYCGKRQNVSRYEGSTNYKFLQGSICDKYVVQKVFSENDIDYVVHFAAQTHVDRSIASADEFAETNVIGTLNLLNAAMLKWSAGTNSMNRFLYISTDEVYGELPSAGYFTEEAPLRPRNPYSASKAGGELLARAFYETHGLPVLVTRCTNNYGPYQYEEKLIPNCIKCCLTGQEIPIYGDGKNIRDWLFVKDHCIAIDMVLRNGQPGDIYNIGGHNEHTNLDIVNILRTIMKNEFQGEASPIKYVADRKGHDRRYAIDPAKICNELAGSRKLPFMMGFVKQSVGIWSIKIL
jgi:dTDP-glucose 4,6-dehydratase